MLSSRLLFVLTLLVATTAFGQNGFIVTGDSVVLKYEITGSGRDTVVVPDGGWQLPYYKRNADGIVYILYDCRNRGRSGTSESVSLQHDINDLESVREFFKIRRMNVLGWSYLGGVAALYASRHPASTRSLIQVGAIPLKKDIHFSEYLNSTQKRRSKTLDAELAKLKASKKDQSDRNAYCKKFYEASLFAMISDTVNAPKFASALPCDCTNEQPEKITGVLGKLFSTLGDWDWRPELNNIRAKTLIIHGVNDNIPLASSEAWSAMNKQSRLVIFNRSGHLPFAEEPSLFFETIREFVSQ